MSTHRARSLSGFAFTIAVLGLIGGLTWKLVGDSPDAQDTPRPEETVLTQSPVLRGFSIIGSSGKCLAVGPTVSGPETNVQISTCNNSDPNQRWRFTRRGQIRGSSKRCLTVSGGMGVDHANVVVSACTGGANQQWSIGPNGEIHGLSDLCLDVHNGSTVDGTNVKLFRCHNHVAQKWRTTSLTIVGLAKKCLDRQQNGTVAGTNVWLWSCNGTGAQTWRFTMDGKIRGPAGQCLEVLGGHIADGTNVQINTCSPTSAQLWTLTAKGEIRGPGNKCLDVSGGGTADGTNIQLWSCNGTKAQRWRAKRKGYQPRTVTGQLPPQPQLPHPPVDLQNTPLPPQKIEAPLSKPCLQWTVVEQQVCQPRLRCSYVGGTCHTTRNCRKEHVRKQVTKRVCWKRPHLAYTLRRVCTPRWITSNTVRCHNETVMTTVRQPVCKNVSRIQLIKKRECNRTGCSNRTVCVNAPTRVCRKVSRRKMVPECREVPVRINKPQRVCSTVRVKKMVPKRVCRPGRTPQCRNQNVCTTRSQRKCRPIRRTVNQRVCRTVTSYRNQNRQQCTNVPQRQTRYKQVCQSGPQRCSTRMQCPNPGNNGFCASRPGAVRCRGCRRLRRCQPGQRKCRRVPYVVTTHQRRCTNRVVRTPFQRQECRNVPRVVTTQQCTMVPQRHCVQKRVCSGPGRPECRTMMVAEFRNVQQCRMVTRPGIIRRRQCRTVSKTVMVDDCRTIMKRRCQMKRDCNRGPVRCVDRLVKVPRIQRVCRLEPVRRRGIRRVCRRQNVRRRLTRCRMERQVKREMRRHCADRRFFRHAVRWRCDQGINCLPGREVCKEVPLCRTRYDQVCAAW